jgi:hypothetical protein
MRGSHPVFGFVLGLLAVVLFGASLPAASAATLAPAVEGG